MSDEDFAKALMDLAEAWAKIEIGVGRPANLERGKQALAALWRIQGIDPDDPDTIIRLNRAMQNEDPEVVEAVEEICDRVRKPTI